MTRMLSCLLDGVDIDYFLGWQSTSGGLSFALLGDSTDKGPIVRREIDLIEMALCGAVGAVMGADAAMPRDLPLSWSFVAVLAGAGFMIGAALGGRILDWIQDRLDGLWW